MSRLMKPTILSISLAVFSIALRAEVAVTHLQSNSPPKDVLIVGQGISGLCAALEAARAGAGVTVIDMGSVFGGHAVMSSGMVCMVDTPEQSTCQVTDSAELACQDFMRFGEDANAGWVRFFAKNSRREVYDWLHELGIIGWELYPQEIGRASCRERV